MKTAIVYSSKTGNTKKLAYAIKDELGFEIFSVEDKPNLDNYELIFYGFWVDKGEIDENANEFLKTLKDKKIALFYTAGLEKEHEYVDTMNEQFMSKVSEQNKALGCFMSQGAISDEIIEFSKQLAKQNPDNPRYAITEQKQNRWNESKLHPSEEDLKDLKQYAKEIINKEKQ